MDDKRQEAEKKLLLLNVQYESVVNQYDLSKKQMNKLKVHVCYLPISYILHKAYTKCVLCEAAHCPTLPSLPSLAKKL